MTAFTRTAALHSVTELRRGFQTFVDHYLIWAALRWMDFREHVARPVTLAEMVALEGGLEADSDVPTRQVILHVHA